MSPEDIQRILLVATQSNILITYYLLKSTSVMKKQDDFTFLPDEPTDSNQDGFFSFYHDLLEPALRDIVKSKTSPKTIGIYGPWGTGKSTIIKMLKADTENLEYPIFVFDAWKYQKDSLRRTFLIKFDRFLRKELGRELPEHILKDFYAETQSGTITPEDAPDTRKWWQIIRDYLRNHVAFTATLVVLLAFVLVNGFFGDSQFVKNIQSLWPYVVGLPVIIAVGPEILKAIASKIVIELTTINTGKTRQVIETESTKVLNSPEQFEDRFSKLLEFISEEKAIIVFDNIDRVPADIAISMLSTIKTFMEPDSKAEVISIVPVDPDAINERVKTMYPDSTNDPENSRYAADEYLRKVFNIILWLPNYMPTELEEYTKAKLKLTGSISSIINKYDVIVVINAAYRKNPRDIIQFINNFIALVLVARQSDVKDIVLKNIGYLAKVQVIRQQFPVEYKELQKNWNNPEGIASKNKAFNEFIAATNRITVDDAEPYIFFKDPLGSRMLRDRKGVFTSLTTNDEIAFAKYAKKESKDALTSFTIDLLKKYRYLDPQLPNIYNTQFHGLFDEVPQEQKPEYYTLLASLLDSDLWRNHEKLDYQMTFKLLGASEVKHTLKRAVIDRYIQATELKLDTGNRLNYLVASNVISGYLSNADLFSKSDVAHFNSLIEKYSDLNKDQIEELESHQLRLTLVSAKSILKYVNESKPDNLSKTLGVVQKYSANFKDTKMMQQLIPAIKVKFDDLEAVDPGYTEKTPDIARVLAGFMSTFSTALKDVEDQSVFDSIASQLLRHTSGAPNDSTRAGIYRALWWIEGHTSPSIKQSIINQLTNFIQTTDPQGFKAFFQSWSKSYKITLIENQLKQAVLTRSLDTPEIVDTVNQYYFEDDQNEKGDEFLRYTIANSSPNATNDTLFIESSKLIHDPQVILEALITKLRNHNISDELYVKPLNKVVPRNGNPVLKQIIADYVYFLIEQNDLNHIQNASKMIDGLTSLTIPLKKELFKKLVEHLKISSIPLNTFVLKQVNVILDHPTFVEPSDLSTIQSLLASNFNSQLDQSSSQVSLDLLKKTPDFNYRTQTGLVTTIANSITIWPEPTYKDFALEKLKAFKSTRPIAGEKAFWQSVDESISKD